MTENPRHYCMVPMPDKLSGQERAFVLNEVKWHPGTQIRVHFLDGDRDLQKRVIETAREWTGPQMANLGLELAGSADADVRIAFEQGNGSWSYLGTEAQRVRSGQPTMNFGWLTPDSDDVELHSVVLHEFGHALGLIHEHQNPVNAIDWNRAAVINDLSGPPNNWDAATIDNNMFTHYNAAEGTGTAVDPHSIMMYPIPASWTDGKFSVGFNSELSETDKEFIRGAYP
jgi:serralysin